MNDPTQNKLNDPQISTECQTNPPIMKHLIFTSGMHQMQTDKSQMNNLNMNHKRCSTLDSGVNKRLKSNTISNYDLNILNSIDDGQQRDQNQQSAILQKSHLLQQLMAPTPQRNLNKNADSKSKIITDNINEGSSWMHNGRCDRLMNQSSDSVLKNLLVSGCDIGAGYICNVPVRLKKLAKA